MQSVSSTVLLALITRGAGCPPQETIIFTEPF
jgi:hypothetical protein